MTELSNARELSQPSEGSSLIPNFNYITASSIPDITSEGKSGGGIAGSAKGQFPDAQDLLKGLSGMLQEEQHLKGSTIPLGTVPYLEGIDPKNASQEERQKLIDRVRKLGEV